MVHGERKAREERNDDANLERCPFPVGADNARHNRIAYPVLDLRLADHGGCDEELVLDVHEVLGHLDRCSTVIYQQYFANALKETYPSGKHSG